MFKQIIQTLPCIYFAAAGIAGADTDPVAPLIMVSDVEITGIASEIGFLVGGEHFYVSSGSELSSVLSISKLPTVVDQDGQLSLDSPDSGLNEAIVREFGTSIIDVAASSSGIVTIEGELPGGAFDSYTFNEYNFSLDAIATERRVIEGVPGQLTISSNGAVFLPVLSPETRGSRVIEAFAKESKSTLNRLRLVQPTHQFWHLPETDMYIANSASQSNLSLIRWQSSQFVETIESIGYSASGAPARFQYSVDLRPATAECKFSADPDPIVLLADYALGSITALRFDSFFNNLNIFSHVQIRPSTSRQFEADTLAGTPFNLSPFLIAASCDRRRVLLGSKISNELIELSVDSDLEVMEVVQVHRLGFEPSAIAVSADGTRALVADRRSQRLTVFAEGPSSVVRPVTDSDVIRQVQRELTVQGYPTGPIDGEVGKQTRFALELWEEATGVALPVGDFAQTLSILTSWTARRIDRIIVGSEPDVPLEVLREYHLSLGWQDIGAHYFVTTGGQVLEGRSIDLTPAFSLGSNKGTVGVALACSAWTDIPNRPTGGCEFSTRQIQAAQTLIKGLSQRFGVSADQVALRSRLRDFTPLLEPVFDQLLP